MTKEELISELHKIVVHQEVCIGTGTDIEYDHVKADELLLKYIGDQVVSEEFNNIRKWYC